MKRQAIGVRRSSDELEDADSNENKRIKLLNNGTENENLEELNCDQAKTADSSPKKSLHKHYHEHQIPVISQNGSTEDKILSDLPSQVIEQSSNLNINKSIENSNDLELSNINHNGSCDEVVVKVSSSDSGIVSELYYSDSQSDSVSNPQKVQLSDEAKSMPVLMSYGELDMRNGESANSFQSEGFEAMRSSNELENKKPKPSSSQEKDTCQEKFGDEIHEKESSAANVNDTEPIASSSQDAESGAKSDVSNKLDLDNLTLSHLEVSQFEGHPDIIFSVAADEDVILSSSGDTTVKVWSIEEKSIISNFSGHTDSVTSVHLLSQSQSDALKEKLKRPEISRIAITGSLDCHIKLWSVFEGHELASIYTFNGITCLGYLEAESYVVVGTEGGKLELWDLCTSKVVQSVRAHEDSISDIKVLDCNIYSVSTDGTVKIWLFEEEDIYPVYTRKRKERSSKDKDLGLAQWKTVAIANNIMYLGDNTNAIKVLDSRAGRLRLFKNQLAEEGICECVTSKEDILLTSFYDSSADAGGVNVWRLPDMTYMCTLSGEIQDVCCLAVVRKGDHLRIVTGGHQLLLWDFDFARPPNKASESSFHAAEIDFIGHEIAENVVNIQAPDSKVSATTNPNESNPNKWCNIM